MRYLLDTNILKRVITESDELSREVREIVYGYDSILYVSFESIKEAIQLFQTGRLTRPKGKKLPGILEFVEISLGYEIKYASREHFATLESLPFLSSADPSDRLIIAQAITEKLTLVSSDLQFEAYVPQGLKLVFNDKTEGHGKLRRRK